MNGKIAHIILFILLLFLTIHTQVKQIEVIDYYAKVYLAPNPKSKFIGLAQKGEIYEVVNVTDYWYRIQFKAALGWVMRSQFGDYDPNAQMVSPTTADSSSQSDTSADASQTDSLSKQLTEAPESTFTSQDSAKGKVSQRTSPQALKAQRAVRSSKAETKEYKPVKRESRLKNWFTQQNIFSNPPANHDAYEPETKYLQVTFAPARVLVYLSPDSPILGMAKKGELLPLVGEGDSWCKVVFADTIGWIERKNGKIIESETSSSSFNFKAIGLFVAMAVIFILIIIFWRIFTKKHNSPLEDKQSIAAKKNVLIIAKSSKHIQHTLTNTNTTLEKCFSELGFHHIVAKDLPSIRNALSQTPPDLVLIDMEFDRNILASIERIFAQLPGSEKILFIIYNVPDPSSMRPSRVYPKMIFLGLYFSDQDIFKLVTPLLLLENAQNVQKSIQSSALEGNIADGNLMEVLQYIEIGSKTGCILIENDRPLALVYFNNGRIIYAATSQGILGRDAVFAVLNMKEGKFRFILNRKPKTSNANMSTLEVLMEWTKAVDEANGH